MNDDCPICRGPLDAAYGQPVCPACGWTPDEFEGQREAIAATVRNGWPVVHAWAHGSVVSGTELVADLRSALAYLGAEPDRRLRLVRGGG